MYYQIDETAARRAKEMTSFSDYQEGSATAGYCAAVDKAAALVAKKKEQVSPFYHDKLDSLLDRYARRLADNINARNRNTASCPSVMICGPANFPTRKKAKQNAREDSLWREYSEIEDILSKIKAIGTGAIDLADPHARELLTDRIQRIQKELDDAKAMNAWHRKHKTLMGFPGLSEEEAARLDNELADLEKRCPWLNKPFPDYELASLRGKLKRTQERLAELDKLKAQRSPEESHDGFTIVRNADLNRLQILFDGIPDETIRAALKANAFRWSPKNKAWQRQLTPAAEAAAKKALGL